MLCSFDHQQFTIPQADLVESDEQLMSRIKERQDSALAEMHRRHKSLLRTVIADVVHHDHDVDEVLQDVFVELWRRVESYDPAKGKPLGWLVTLTRRRAIDRVRRRVAYRRTEERNRLETEAHPEKWIQQGADVDAQDSDRAAIFRRILSSLPEAQQQALELAFYRGLSQREIAAQTGIPLGTIKTRLELGVRKVRAAVLQMGDQEQWSLKQ
jgi:RNA polymerase sigma-70 factor (ECF subfamily)